MCTCQMKVLTVPVASMCFTLIRIHVTATRSITCNRIIWYTTRTLAASHIIPPVNDIVKTFNHTLTGSSYVPTFDLCSGT